MTYRAGTPLLALLAVSFVHSAQQPADLARRAFEAANHERARRGIPRLAWDEEVAALARSHSRRMRDLGFFSHQDPERGGLEARLKGARVSWRSAAENVFEEHGLANPAQQAVKAWLGSPGHRRNMLGRGFTRTGVGVATNGEGKYWFTQIFVGGGKP